MKFTLNHNHYVERFKNSPEFKKSIIYIVSSTIGFGIVLVQNFSLAFLTSVGFFGKITLLISLFSTLYVIFTFGMNAVVMRYYFDKHYSDKRSLLSQITAIWFLLGMGIIIILLLAGYRLFEFASFLPLDYYSEFIPVLLGAFLYSSTEIFPNFYVAQEKPLPYAAWLISTKFSIFLLLHATIYFFGESSRHVAFALFLSGLILFLAVALIFRLQRLSPINKADLNEILKYAFPLMIYALGGIGYSHGYRVIISKWLTYQDLALFTMANQIAMVYYLTAVSCVIGFQPKAYTSLEGQHGHPRAARFYLQILLLTGLGLAILMLPAGYVFLKYFKGGSFLPAFNILPILLGGQFLYFLYGYNYILATYHKKTRLLTYSMLAGVMTSLFLTSVLLDASSLLGAALPVVCGITIQYLISLIAIRRIALKAALRQLNGDKNE